MYEYSAYVLVKEHIDDLHRDAAEARLAREARQARADRVAQVERIDRSRRAEAGCGGAEAAA